MTGTFETMVLLDNREVKKGWEACKKQVCDLFEKHEAEIVSAKRWDELRLAFPIKRQLRGTYMLLYYNVDGNNQPAIKRELEYNETVLRYLTKVCEEIPEDAREPEAAFDIESVRVEEVGEEAPPPAEKAEKKAEKTEKAEESEANEASAKAKAKEGPVEDAKPEPEPESSDQGGNES